VILRPPPETRRWVGGTESDRELNRSWLFASRPPPKVDFETRVMERERFVKNEKGIGEKRSRRSNDLNGRGLTNPGGLE
jgi:hypothetical protein